MVCSCTTNNRGHFPHVDFDLPDGIEALKTDHSYAFEYEDCFYTFYADKADSTFSANRLFNDLNTHIPNHTLTAEQIASNDNFKVINIGLFFAFEVEIKDIEPIYLKRLIFSLKGINYEFNVFNAKGEECLSYNMQSLIESMEIKNALPKDQVNFK